MATGFHAIAQKSSRLLFNRFKIARRRSAYTPLHHILERKPVRGNSCSCPCRTPWNDYVIRDIITPRWHARWYRFYDARRIRSCGDFWHKQHSFIVRQAVFLRRVVVDFCRRWTGGQQWSTIQCLIWPSCSRHNDVHVATIIWNTYDYVYDRTPYMSWILFRPRHVRSWMYTKSPITSVDSVTVTSSLSFRLAAAIRCCFSASSYASCNRFRCVLTQST